MPLFCWLLEHFTLPLLCPQCTKQWLQQTCPPQPVEKCLESCWQEPGKALLQHIGHARELRLIHTPALQDLALWALPKAASPKSSKSPAAGMGLLCPSSTEQLAELDAKGSVDWFSCSLNKTVLGRGCVSYAYALLKSIMCLCFIFIRLLLCVWATESKCVTVLAGWLKDFSGLAQTCQLEGLLAAGATWETELGNGIHLLVKIQTNEGSQEQEDHFPLFPGSDL